MEHFQRESWKGMLLMLIPATSEWFQSFIRSTMICQMLLWVFTLGLEVSNLCLLQCPVKWHCVARLPIIFRWEEINLLTLLKNEMEKISSSQFLHFMHLCPPSHDSTTGLLQVTQYVDFVSQKSHLLFS